MKNKFFKIILFSLIPFFVFYINGKKLFAIVFFCFILFFIILDTASVTFNQNFRKILKIFAHNLTKFILLTGYWFIVTPLGVLSKILKRDKLKIKKYETTSYWIDENQKYDYERQF